MVRGLNVFKEHFRAHTDKFVLIGGTAATITMSLEEQPFRATKDLDIVLIVEVLTAEFGRDFWAFIQKGGYAIREVSEAKGPTFYRFQKPENAEYPAMLELFSRTPDGIILPEDSHLTPIPLDEAVSSLSAILLDKDYYAFILDGRRDLDELPYIGEDRLIPLKARAWLDMIARRDGGVHVDSKEIKKHVHDVIRLSQLMTPSTRVALPEPLQEDLKHFIEMLISDGAVEPKALGFRNLTLKDVTGRLATVYGLP